MNLKRPGYIEIAAQAFVLLLIAMMLAEFFQAAGAVACREAVAIADDCYPWGAEGPAADSWQYASKTAYLISIGIEILILAMALAIPFVVERTVISLGLMLLLVFPALGIFF